MKGLRKNFTRDSIFFIKQNKTVILLFFIFFAGFFYGNFFLASSINSNDLIAKKLCRYYIDFVAMQNFPGKILRVMISNLMPCFLICMASFIPFAKLIDFLTLIIIGISTGVISQYIYEFSSNISIIYCIIYCFFRIAVVINIVIFTYYSFKINNEIAVNYKKGKDSQNLSYIIKIYFHKLAFFCGIIFSITIFEGTVAHFLLEKITFTS